MNITTIADYGITTEGREAVLHAVHTYFQNLNDAVEPYGDEFGLTREDAITQLVHDLESTYLDWSNS